MRVRRIFSDAQGRTRMEWREVPLDSSERPTSAPLPPTQAFFRETEKGHVHKRHNAPRRQLIIVISGIGEIELPNGETWRFGPGDVTFAENTTGEGHITRTLEGVRTFCYLPMSEEFDITQWPLVE
jgi:hypothetical protein